MLTVWIWGWTMATLLPSTVGVFWLVNRFAGDLFTSQEPPSADRGAGSAIDVQDRFDDEELQFSEMSAAEIDDIIDYYEKRDRQVPSR